ncbi:MAG: HutD family protein [Lysobacter sp.]|nr:HutD family protein [Lysobacter sp.]
MDSGVDGGGSHSWVIPANEYRRERWRNQLGWTREIHRSPASGDWDWRLSIAEIEHDAPFSSFPGIDRELVLLSGNGLRLRFDDGELQELAPPHGKLCFAGERGVTGELVDGPTHDFNLMWRRGRVQAELWHRPLVGQMVIFAEPRHTWAVHLISGHARFADDSGLAPLETGDTAVLIAGRNRLRHVLDGGGEALLIRISPVGSGDVSSDMAETLRLQPAQ